ncbi:verprolin-like isoform X1 [Triticum dicoccoides]|uniref:verprolin-like isoform X1 n=1 Tax=Triticum dicoccoides TaxID=85692 RepID=UPI00188F6CDB|nr:verprolin-like isoform X1 [Triticum dicoccoides]
MHPLSHTAHQHHGPLVTISSTPSPSSPMPTSASMPATHLLPPPLRISPSAQHLHTPSSSPSPPPPVPSPAADRRRLCVASLAAAFPHTPPPPSPLSLKRPMWRCYAWLGPSQSSSLPPVPPPKFIFFVTQSSIRASRSNSLEASLAELQSNINQMGRQMGLKLLALHLKSHTLVTPIWSYSKERSSSINDGYDNIYRLQRSHVLQLRSQCKESDAPAGVHSFSASPLAST